jgi:hypothetical protein
LLLKIPELEAFFRLLRRFVAKNPGVRGFFSSFAPISEKKPLTRKISQTALHERLNKVKLSTALRCSVAKRNIVSFSADSDRGLSTKELTYFSARRRLMQQHEQKST